MSYGVSDALVAEMINQGIVSVFACQRELIQSMFTPSVCLKCSSDTKLPSVLSSKMDLVGGSRNSTPTSSSNETAVVSKEC